MNRATGLSRYVRGTTSLDDVAQRRFDLLATSHGVTKLASLLKVGDTMIVRLKSGGIATPGAIARVAARLAELEAQR